MTMSLIRINVSNYCGDEINLYVLFKNVEGSLLELFIKEHCSTKKELNISAFSLKSVTYLFWCLWWDKRNLLFKSVFRVVQYDFVLVIGSTNFFDKWECYFCLLLPIYYFEFSSFLETSNSVKYSGSLFS